MTPEEREFLKAVAQDAVRATLAGGEFEVDLPGADDTLAEPASCFVTLRRRGRLRGCIGLMGERSPLARAVREAAVKALYDPRFPPPRPDEKPDLEVEISVLGPTRPVASPEEIRPGRHGVRLSRGARTAVFLPQVATEQGWGRERLLSELSRKAGLPEDAWRDPETEVFVFEAEVF